MMREIQLKSKKSREARMKTQLKGCNDCPTGQELSSENAADASRYPAGENRHGAGTARGFAGSSGIEMFCAIYPVGDGDVASSKIVHPMKKTRQ